MRSSGRGWPRRGRSVVAGAGGAWPRLGRSVAAGEARAARAKHEAEAERGPGRASGSDGRREVGQRWESRRERGRRGNRGEGEEEGWVTDKRTPYDGG